jgi:hypothetical protein
MGKHTTGWNKKADVLTDEGWIGSSAAALPEANLRSPPQQAPTQYRQNPALTTIQPMFFIKGYFFLTSWGQKQYTESRLGARCPGTDPAGSEGMCHTKEQ